MVEQNVSRPLQKSILVYSAFGIFTVSLIVAAICIIPLYRHLRKDVERNLLFALKTRTMIVEQYLSKAKDVARQITSRTKAREMLESYNNGRVSLDEFKSFSRNILTDALAKTQEVQGISRLDRNGNLVLQVGQPIPKNYWPVLADESKDAAFHGPVGTGSDSCLVISAWIINRKSERVGTDIVLYKLSGLHKIMEHCTGMGENLEAVLGVVHKDRIKLITPLRHRISHAASSISSDSPVGSALKMAAGNLAGILVPDRSQGGHDVIAYGPIKETGWGILVKMNRKELYTPVYRQVVVVSSVTILMILLGTLGMVLLLRPLAGKMIIHADQMEREILEKTSALQNELNERTQAEEALARSNEELTSANKELDAFSYSVSHDLRAPLRAIDGFSNILEEDYSNRLDEKGKHFLKRVRAGTQTMDQLIDGLLDLSRLGRRPINRQELDLESIAQEVYASLEHEWKGRNMEFTLNRCPPVHADSSLMKVVFTNFLSNALKFTRHCSTTKIEVGCEIQDQQTLFFVKDNGAGFDMRYAEKLFVPFQRLHSLKDYEGSGIGLSIVQRVIHRHGGRIQVESSPGSGTTFYFTLPGERS